MMSRHCSLNFLLLAAIFLMLLCTSVHPACGFSNRATSPSWCPRSRLAAGCQHNINNGPSLRLGESKKLTRPANEIYPRRQSKSYYWALQSKASSQAADTKNNIMSNNNKIITEEEINQSMEYLNQLIKHQLGKVNKPIKVENSDAAAEDEVTQSEEGNDDMTDAYQLAKGRFIDLTSTLKGEQLLENLFLHNPIPTEQEQEQEQPNNNSITTDNIRIIQHAITTLQSLLIYGMQVGVKGSEESQQKMVRHLFRRGDPPQRDDNIGAPWTNDWNSESIRRLKYHRNVQLGKLLLAKLIRKRTAQGAYDLLVELGIWDRHEDTALLRSGFPVRFLESEEIASREAESSNMHDPDDILGIRRDLRHHKVYTVDSASTLDIDDGISVEVLDDDDGTDGDDDGDGEPRHRYWIHIADVDRWAPRGSKLLEVAERRGTSLYLPTMTLCMFPPNMSSGTMSLESWEDKHALSLGVELNPDGSINPTSIIVTSSLIHVDYRLTYDQVDEMLDEGVGYTEEWQIGALLAAATKRRAHRVARGSTEGMVPFPIPRGMVSADYNEESKDYDISLKIETTHNSGANMTAGGNEVDEHYDPYCSPVSSSQLVVTEMMILAGEAMGKWQQLQPVQEDITPLDDGRIPIPNMLELPFRCQPAPQFKSRESETRQMNFLFAMNKRYPHAWYARRFFNKVTISEKPGPHFGMGLDCYVQWSSPIRRLTDLQVHSAVKRYLRRKRVNELLEKGLPIPSELSSIDLGCDVAKIQQTASNAHTVDPIDYTSALGMIFAGRPIQSSSSNYWLFEYIRQMVDKSDDEVMFESIVLGCVNKERFQYAIYVYELGLEHRYLSETGKLEEGRKIFLKVSSVNPRMELLTFSLASRSGGIHAQQLSAPAA